MTNEIQKYKEKIFDDIKHIDEDGNEYWFARELMPVLGYYEWRKFNGAIKKALEACKTSNYKVSDHIVGADNMIIVGKGAKRKVEDYKLSRYACYLIVQNCDPRKEQVALGQTYFAIQTRKQELLEEEYKNLSEDEKRLKYRKQTRSSNLALNKTAVNAGVKNLDKFHNAGYKGLYNGETANDIAKRKGLRYRQDILDHMGSSELIANLFRIDQTNQKMINENIQGELKSCETHFQIGKDIRNFINEHGGTMPEDLPTPNKSIKDIKSNRKEITNGK